MSADQEQIDYWNGDAGATWVDLQERLDRMLAPVSEATIASAGIAPGDRVLDVGCGCGDTSLALADRDAVVLGIDVSEPMLARARARAGDRATVRFECLDAATASLPEDRQVLFSRFGVMFFDDPKAAFTNLRASLVDGGRLVFACWQAAADNPWIAIAGRAVKPFLAEPETRPDPRAPGPFAFADAAWIEEVLDAAGFVDIDCAAFRPALHLADDLDGAIDFQSRVGPLSRALAELDGDDRARALEAAREALAPHVTDAGLVLEGACWIVTARDPG